MTMLSRSLASCVFALMLSAGQATVGQPVDGTIGQPVDGKDAEPRQADAPTEVPQSVEVEPKSADDDIARRLTRILRSTRLFENPSARVDEGVVFLTGYADDERRQEWAGQLATKTEGVVAVVNRIEVQEASMWDLTPAADRLRELATDAVRSSPLIALGLLLLVATWFATKWSVRGTSSLLGRRFQSQLLRDVVARAVAVPIFLLGL